MSYPTGSGLSKTDPAAKPQPSRSVSELKTARLLTEWFEHQKRGRSILENQWKLNLAFYKGRQYVYYNKHSRRIEQLPVEEGDKPRFRVRLVSNQIMSGCHSLLSKFTKTKPVMHATPGTGSDRDLKASQLSERLLQYWWQDFQLDDTLEEALLWALIAGQGYWEICWDEHAGKQLTFLLDPNGQPVTDPMVADLFRGQLTSQGIQPEEQTVYLGDIRVQAVSPFDIYLDNTVPRFNECKWCVRVMHMSPDAVKGKWGKDLQPDAVAASPDSTLPMGGNGTAEKNVVKVMCAYFLPQPVMPKGRIVTWQGDLILEDRPWDYPTQDLPFVKFPGVRIPGAVYDTSVVEHAIPLQKELNRTLSQIVEYKNLTIKPQVMAPVGSLRARLTNEPGAVFQYTPIGNFKPEPVPLPAMPAYVFEHLNTIAARLSEIFGITEVTEGSVPPNVEAGVAIDLLQEMAIDRITPTIRLMELAIARAGRLMLSLAKHYYVEPRLMKIRGFGGASQVKQFSQSDIDGAIDVVVESGSGLPRTRAGKQARVEWMVANGLIQPNESFKYLDTADLTGLADILQLDEDQALREHDKVMAGLPINPLAAQQAQQQVAQGVDEQGNPIQSPEQAQQIIQQAAVQPNFFDNHQVHIDQHSRFMKSLEYESMQPEMQTTLQQHMMAHFNIMLSMPANPEPQAPRVNLQIKSTVGPDGQSQILKRAGVNLTPEQAAEPPIETWVSDSLDKANQDTEASASQIAMEQAKAAQDMQTQEAQHHQDMRHSEEAHGQRMDQAAHQTRVAEQKARLQEQVTRRGPPPRSTGGGKK